MDGASGRAAAPHGSTCTRTRESEASMCGPLVASAKALRATAWCSCMGAAVARGHASNPMMTTRARCRMAAAKVGYSHTSAELYGLSDEAVPLLQLRPDNWEEPFVKLDVGGE